MLQAWRAASAMSFCGYIPGFQEDTATSIAHDIEVLKRELPVDCLEFFVLTPLPGSEDHQRLHRASVPMERDMNKYDLEHVCAPHGRMTRGGVGLRSTSVPGRNTTVGSISKPWCAVRSLTVSHRSG